MTAFHEALRSRLAEGGYTTDDALAAFLPLLREVLEAHAAGTVAPLEGLDALQVDGPRIWFPEDRRLPPRNNPGALRKLQAAQRSNVEIVAEVRRTRDVNDGGDGWIDLAIGNRNEPVTRPVYLPGYVAWEHALAHHDPATDVFSLGLILASLACRLDLAAPQDLARFVSQRRNLFALRSDLHPVLAQAIVRMTELDRHRRAPDLGALRQSLENYREQEVDLEFDLARMPGFVQQDRRSKQGVVLTRLRERLFEISRRNRLLHFRPTLQSVNLTQASIPLTCDIQNIAADRILVWNAAVHASVVGGQPLSLNKYLNFSEALYLPSVLDHILADARRDQAEFGFAQLRLVACFLHWTNLKQRPLESFESPLVLVPVELKKKKGIRDTYVLEPLASEAEVNPVVRHQFKQLYDIDLPETIDLAATTLDAFFEFLQARIQASEPAVTLAKIDRPRIALIHEKARRRLDQYTRRARLAGRGVRSLNDLDYSYDPANYHPLGVRLFAARIRPPATRLRETIQERPRPRSYAAPPSDAPGPDVVESQRTFFSVQEGGEENPYVWNYDLCSVTLGNFKYRKMSLVRDYEALLTQQPANPAFDATFSLAPREPARPLPAARSVEDRFDVVPCDPTQASAIEESHSGRSYIIQGPPGTGKSQTITNLIADYLARGKRVLFVCEKRAAIDVVYARLRQRGLGDLCCLIHDSQTDKREFIADLKRTYEDTLALSARRTGRTRRRNKLVDQIREELQPLEAFDTAMQHAHPRSGVPLRQLLRRCIELRDRMPALTPLARERLPDYQAWWLHHDRLQSFAGCVHALRSDGVLAAHPLRLLSPHLAEAERPLEKITRAVEAAGPQLQALEATLNRSGVPRDAWSSLGRARMLVNYARRALPIAEAGQLELLDPDHRQVKPFAAAVQRLRRQEKALAKARVLTAAWREKLPRQEVAAALAQAQAFARAALPWLRPGWWRLRGRLRRSYDFAVHATPRTWVQVLQALDDEYQVQAEWERQRQNLADKYTIEGEVEPWIAGLQELQKMLPALPGWLAQVHAGVMAAKQPLRMLEPLVAADEPLRGLSATLSGIVAEHEEHPLETLAGELQQAVAALDALPEFLQCLRHLAALPDGLASALRTLPHPPQRLEAAAADRSLTEIVRGDRALQAFTGPSRDRHAERLQQLYDQWLTANGEEICHRVQKNFLEHVHVSSLGVAQLTDEQRVFKQRYTRGRRELEHEFGKTMRYKSIRDLVSGESGEVVRDLKPVWLMSPLSVSDTLPLDSQAFDVVIFDEASQITLEEVVPSLFRAPQAIVVGDEMQLPPTDFFSVRRGGDEDEELLVEEQGELVAYELASNSFLSHAARNLPSTMLGWHYRSRSESLISFSNWAFYDGRLLTVPERRPAAGSWHPLEIAAPEDAQATLDALLERPVSFHHTAHGVYDKRRNRGEAEYIAQLVRALLQRQTGRSIGIVAFSEAQQDEIEAALERLAQDDSAFRDLLEAERERESDGQYVGLLVKNLENIQGDERDVVILSVCYGPGPHGRMLMNFGPINRSGGEKRLNVAFSRAKHHMAVVASMHASAITNEYNDGANCLKNYLRYAEAVSAGQRETALRILHGASPWSEAAEPRDVEPVAEQLARALVEQGFQVDRAIGESHFRCDLAVRRPGEPTYCLAILLDSDAYYEQSDLLERDMMRPRLLREFGWPVAFVLAKDWYADAAGVVRRLVEQIGD